MSLLACVSLFIVPESYLNNFEDIPKIPKTPPAAVPVGLLIESIAVVAPVDSVGILGKAMAVPANNTDVGWYDLGVIPGDVGTAVFAGHVNWFGGRDAIFTNLHLLQVGDIVSVMYSYGPMSDFIVRDIKRYPADADTSEVFSSDDGLAHLNLITCDGIWSVVMGTHESRLVVFTEKL